MFNNIESRKQLLNSSVREDAMWAAYQANREAGLLVEVILFAQTNPDTHQYSDIEFRYDILYSRQSLLLNGTFAIRFGDDQGIANAATSTGQAIADFEPLLEQKDTSIEYTHHLTLLLEAASLIRRKTENLVSETNARLNLMRVAERERDKEANRVLGVSVLFLVCLFIAIGSLQAVQLWFLSRTNTEMEKLSLHNSQIAETALQATKEKSMFLAVMSHEIRTPLNGIIGATELALLSELNKKQKEYIDIIHKSGRLLLDVITDILDFSKLEAGQFTYKNTSFYLPDVMSNVAVILQPKIRDAGLKFEIDAAHVHLTADPILLKQVLVNLIGNAIKFTPSGSVTVKAYQASQDIFRFDVFDTGIGISETGIEKLFKDFSQADDTASNPFTGTGLGLAITKRIVDRLGGKIGVESIQGMGSRFWFEIPVQDVVHTVSPMPSFPEGGNRESLEHLYDLKILLAEDNIINQRVAKELLNILGASVVIAQNGEEALYLSEQYDFDLIFMDVQMPIMNGLEAVRHIRASGNATPIVGLTANAFMSDRDDCISAGMDDFISKPITLDKLRKILSCFDGSEVHKHLLDRNHIKGLIIELGSSMLLELLEAFFSDIEHYLDDALQAMNLGNEDTFDKSLHGLIGSAQTLGLLRISTLAKELRTNMYSGQHIIRNIRISAKMDLQHAIEFVRLNTE